MGPVDLLWGLNLLLGRAAAVGADFILAGPVSLWLKGATPPPREARFILVTSRDHMPHLLKALEVGAEKLDWGGEWASVEGKAARLLLRGMIVEILVDPKIGGRSVSASRLARESEILLVGGYPARLAPMWFEVLLSEALERGGEE
ncbi:MAG: hypothetical protein GSR80_000636 [Desulfurococcales archaeon]|nr:hypothetical protein [Desulfurococcales archaeon]